LPRFVEERWTLELLASDLRKIGKYIEGDALVAGKEALSHLLVEGIVPALYCGSSILCRVPNAESVDKIANTIVPNV